MTAKVYTWKEAMKTGYDLRQYNYLPANPGSICIARLDFKLWAQKVIAINGYFTEKEGAYKFQVTCYPSKRTGYRIGRDLIDVHRCQTGLLYCIEVQTDKAGRWVLQNISLVPGS